MILRAKDNDDKSPTEQEEYKVGPCKPPKEYQWQKGQSGNPNGPPVPKTQSWIYLCKYVAMTDAEIEALDRSKLTQSQQMALSLVEKEARAGSRTLAPSIFDREEGRAVQTNVVVGGDRMSLAEALLLASRNKQQSEPTEFERSIA